MNQFRLGQKVRLIRCNNPKCIHKIGDVGVVDALPGSALNHMSEGERLLYRLIMGHKACDSAYRVDMPNGVMPALPDDLEPVFDNHQGVDREELLKALPDLEHILGAPA